MRRHAERGVALLEAAITLPVVFLLLFGAVEFGFAWRDINRVEHALQSAGRTGASIATGRFADYELLRAISAGVDGMTGAVVERVVVFEASPASSTVPAACLSIDVTTSPLSPKGSTAGGSRCNVYSRQQVDTPSPVGFPDNGSGGCAAGSWDATFCPKTQRSRGLDDATYLGVYVRVRYTPLTTVISGPTLDISRTAVFRLEPCVPSIEACP